MAWSVGDTTRQSFEQSLQNTEQPNHDDSSSFYDTCVPHPEGSLRRVKEADRFFKVTDFTFVRSGTNQRPRKNFDRLPKTNASEGIVFFPSVCLRFPFPHLSSSKTKQSEQEGRERGRSARFTRGSVVLSRRSSRVKRTSRPENLCHVAHTTRKNLGRFSRSHLRVLPRLPPPPLPLPLVSSRPLMRLIRNFISRKKPCL